MPVSQQLSACHNVTMFGRVFQVLEQCSLAENLSWERSLVEQYRHQWSYRGSQSVTTDHGRCVICWCGGCRLCMMSLVLEWQHG